jgi:hypothetical protein
LSTPAWTVTPFYATLRMSTPSWSCFSQRRVPLLLPWTIQRSQAKLISYTDDQPLDPFHFQSQAVSLGPRIQDQARPERGRRGDRDFAEEARVATDAGPPRRRALRRDEDLRLDLPERLAGAGVQGLWEQLHQAAWVQPRRVCPDGVPGGLLRVVWCVRTDGSGVVARLIEDRSRREHVRARNDQGVPPWPNRGDQDRAA